MPNLFKIVVRVIDNGRAAAVGHGAPLRAREGGPSSDKKMRSYISVIRGVYNESSVAFNISIDIIFYAADFDDFQAQKAQFDADVAAAGGDWKGFVKLSEQRWFQMNKEIIVDVIKGLYGLVNSWPSVENNAALESPRHGS